MPKREKARILAAMQQSTQNRGQQRALATELDDQPRLLAAVLRAHMDTCEFTKEKVSAMRQRARECPSYSMPTLLVSRHIYTQQIIQNKLHIDLVRTCFNRSENHKKSLACLPPTQKDNIIDKKPLHAI